MNFTVDEAALRLVDIALAEDRGSGDWTTRWIVPARKRMTGTIVAHQEGILAGLSVVSAVFLRMDARVECISTLVDGDAIKPGDILFTVRGPARALLTGERTAINFLRRLSGVATLTKKYVDAIAGTSAAILDTRCTTPAWRSIEKAAAVAAGAQSSRNGLYDMVVITDEHVAIAGTLSKAIQLIKDANNRDLPIAVQVRNKDELKEALDAGVHRVILSDMDVQAIREAVRLVRKASPLLAVEATGNMPLERVRAVAEAGVDFISVDAITDSPPVLDLSLKLQAL